MTVYLCTCGTSAAKNQTTPRLSVEWVQAQGGSEAAASVLFNGFRNYAINDDTALSRYLSAEINSLAKMGVSPQDRVVLFTSETDDGQACAHAVRLYLEQALPGIECIVRVIRGLQVHDAKQFRTEGVTCFVREVLREIHSYGAAQCILNPTGGFKSLVPYTVLIGMIKKVRARYIFEQSAELLDLPSFPVEFAREKLEPLQALLQTIDRETDISLQDYEQQVSYEDRDFFAPLFEIQGQRVTLSSIGFLMLDEINQPQARVPFLSRKAMEDMEKISLIEGCKPYDFIQRVAARTEQFNNARHEALSNGLIWLKPGQHTRDRYLCSVEGWHLLVWRIMDHDEYQALLDENRQTDLGQKMVNERRTRYAPFYRMEFHY